jgi:hypothetical protein
MSFLACAYFYFKDFFLLFLEILGSGSIPAKLCFLESRPPADRALSVFGATSTYGAAC